MVENITNKGSVNHGEYHYSQKQPEKSIVHSLNLRVSSQLDPQNIKVNTTLEITKIKLPLSMAKNEAKRVAKVTCPALIPTATKIRNSGLETVID
ncbi:hypothetical protein HY085_03620 [Candidatus Gottesmanbacteria bacterium]|nr:hypothetical protein [Candidatus Gottesmanbacteria bacterium]